MIYFNKLIDICINRYESQKVVDNYFVGTNNVSIRTNRTDRYKNQSENKIWLIFCLRKNYPNFKFHSIIEIPGENSKTSSLWLN